MINDKNFTLHYSPSKIENESVSGKGISTFLFQPILKDHLINDLSTKDTSPSEKFFADTIKFFVNHITTTSMAFHNLLLIDNL
jgi:hypothetical protein